MLSEDIIQDFIKSQLPAGEVIHAVTMKKRASSSRINELIQGCLALFVMIFLITLVHPVKGRDMMSIPEKLVAASTLFALSALVFLIYCFFLFRKSDRRISVFTDRRIILFDFNKPLHKLTGEILVSSPKFRRKEIALDLIKSARCIKQKDGSGVLVLEIYDGPQKHTWYHTQLEVGDVQSARLALPNNIPLLSKE